MLELSTLEASICLAGYSVEGSASVARAQGNPTCLGQFVGRLCLSLIDTFEVQGRLSLADAFAAAQERNLGEQMLLSLLSDWRNLARPICIATTLIAHVRAPASQSG